MGAQLHHPWLHCVGSHRGKSFALTSNIILTPPIQAQFIISPDRSFSEMGAITQVNYRDRFIKYKKFIIRNADTPRMRALVERLEKDLLQGHSPDGQVSSAGEPEAIDEEEDFCLAFQNDAVISDSVPTSPILAPSPVEPTALPLDPDVPSPPLPTTPIEPPAAPDSEEPAESLAPATKKKPRKKNSEDQRAVPVNNRRSTRNAGGTTGIVVGGKAAKA